IRYAGLDAGGHYYLRYARPEAFGDVTEDERRRFGRVLDDYYAYVDMLVGEAIASLREGDLLMVVSGFGMEPLTVGKRVLERVAGDMEGFARTDLFTQAFNEQRTITFIPTYGAQ